MSRICSRDVGCPKLPRTIVSENALLFMVSASAPSLRSLDVDAWERSSGVNVRGLPLLLAVALPALCERRGERVVAVGVEDTGGA